jgi:DegV family protein with EDD domain
MGVKIIADTTSCIPVQTAKELGIPYMPQIIIFGDVSYRDDSEIDTLTFLQKLRTSPVLPKTAAPPPALYTPYFQQYSAAGDSILVICPAAEVSGTVRSAESAAEEFPNADIRVIDTRTVSAGLGVLVLQAHQWAKQGLDADTIEKNIKEMASRCFTYVVVDTLEYLHKGGRIGGAKALLGGILQMKPMLLFKDGRLEPVDSLRTQKKALGRLTEIIMEKCPKGPTSRICMIHGDAAEKANELASNYQLALSVPEVPVYEFPPAILTHTGPGVIGTSFFVS